MIKFKEVAEFIQKNKEAFTAFETELKEISKINKDIHKTKGSKLYLKEYSWVEESKESSYTIQYKGTTHKRTPREIFFEVLLNCLPSILSGKEFNFTASDVEQDFKDIKVPTKEEKLVFLSSLYSMIYNIDFLANYENSSLEDFLRERELLIVGFDKDKILKTLDKEIELSDKAKLPKKVYSSGRHLRSFCLIHANQLLSDVRNMRNKIDKGQICSYDKRYYDDLKEIYSESNILPQNTLKRIKKVFDKPQVEEMISNISNDFAIKTAIRSMPDKITETVYVNFTKGIQGCKENEKYNSNEREFIAAKLLIDKYSYKKISTLGYMGWANSYTLTSLNFESNKYYKKLYEMETDMISAYINKNLTLSNMSNTNRLIECLFSFVALYNQPEDKMKTIIESTKETIAAMLEMVSPHMHKKLQSLYNYEDIKSKNFFKELKPELDKYYFYANSKNFLCLTKEQRDLICDNYLNAVILDKTLYLRANKIEINQEPLVNESMVEIFKELADIFDLSRR